MNAKIKKINAEYEKNAAKIADLQARQKELDKQRTELENMDIVGMVRSMGMTPEEPVSYTHLDVYKRQDLMFKELESRQPGHFAVRQYKKYKLAAGKTAKSILISAAARTSIFDIQEVRDLTAYDELELDTLGDRKTALFLIMSCLLYTSRCV